MAAELFPADRTPAKPVSEITENRAAGIRARSFGREILYSEPVWTPGELDREYFGQMTKAAEQAQGEAA